MIRSTFPQIIKQSQTLQLVLEIWSQQEKISTRMCCSLTWKRSQANQLSFQRFLGLLDCFQHLRSTEIPSRCPATAQVWHCRIRKAPKILLGDTTEIEYEGNVFSTPADVDKTKTRHEWKAFKLVIFEEKSLSLNELATLFLRSEVKCVAFPNIRILLTIAMVLPMSTATVERFFNDMKQIKDRLCNQLLPASMFKLMIIAIEGPPLHEVDLDAVLALWKVMKPRRLLI